MILPILFSVFIFIVWAKVIFAVGTEGTISLSEALLFTIAMCSSASALKYLWG